MTLVLVLLALFVVRITVVHPAMVLTRLVVRWHRDRVRARQVAECVELVGRLAFEQGWSEVEARIARHLWDPLTADHVTREQLTAAHAAARAIVDAVERQPWMVDA